MSNPQLTKGIIITCIEDFIVPGTGLTFYYYKGNKYKIVQYLDKWQVHAWEIKLLKFYSKSGSSEIGWFSEEDLIKKFDALKYTRKEKLKNLEKISKLNE